MRAAPNSRHPSPTQVIISGCGAVTALYAAPALARLQSCGEVKVVGLFDPNPAAMDSVRTTLPGAAVAADFDALLRFGAELAIVASPPCLHAEQSIAAMRAGLDVLCEKPLAITIADADRMLAVAHETGRMLAPGHVRRHMPATQFVKALLEGGALGRLMSIDWFEGGPFTWPVASPSYFTVEHSAGGVLPDIGTHVFDLLGWWLGPLRLIEYADDRMGGVEANCQIVLDLDGCEARVRLSRDWRTRNRLVLRGELGDLIWNIHEPEVLELTVPGICAPAVIDLRRNGRAPLDFIDCYAGQISDVIAAARAGVSPGVPASAGRDALALVELCRSAAQPLTMPWLETGSVGIAAIPAELAL